MNLILKKKISYLNSYLILFASYLKKFYYKKQLYKFFANLENTNKSIFHDQVLIDGFWENPNYWLRLNLVIKALNLKNSKKIGLVGKYSRSSVKQSFKIFKINNIIDIYNIEVDKNKIKSRAKYLINNSKLSKEIFEWVLPFNFPGVLLYDSLLKKLNTPTINLNDTRLLNILCELLIEIEVSFKIFSKSKFSLFLCSHSIGSTFGSLVWAAILNKVNVICMYGDYGTLRFIKYNNLNQLTKHILPVPNQATFFSLDKNRELKFLNRGKSYLQKRLNSKTTDIGAKLAIHQKKKNITKKYILEYFKTSNKKIITVFTHHWSDFPHSLGLKNFSDFKEWFDITFEEAKKNKNLLWLFKGHPISERYNYSSTELLQTYISENKDVSHIQVIPNTWEWKSIINASDYIITCLGSIGVEASALNKKVLISEPGLYGHLGFGKVSMSKQDYIKNLKSDWWKNIDVRKSTYNSLKFMGLYYCNPSWLSKLTYKDDSEQNLIYNDLVSFLEKNKKNILKEINCINRWYYSNEPHYHLYKNLSYKL